MGQELGWTLVQEFSQELGQELGQKFSQKLGQELSQGFGQKLGQVLGQKFKVQSPKLEARSCSYAAIVRGQIRKLGQRLHVSLKLRELNSIVNLEVKFKIRFEV